MAFKKKLIISALIAICALSLAFALAACDNSLYSTIFGDDETTTTYTLTIVIDGETVGTTTVESETGNTLNYSSYTSKTGYEFLGYYASDGVMMFDKNGKQLEYGIDQDYTLYGRFSANTYTFKYYYEVNGEYVLHTTQSVVYDTTLTDLAAAPVLEGRDFLGWATTSSGTRLYSNGTTPVNSVFNASNYTITYSGEVCLYAMYATHQFTVTLVYENDAYDDITLYLDYGSELPDLTEYYVITDTQEVVGWSLFKGQVVEFSGTVTMDMALYAVWSQSKTVKFVYTQNDVREVKYYYSSSSCVLPDDAEMDGYSLEGWYSSSTYAGNPVTTTQFSMLADCYYAKWEGLLDLSSYYSSSASTTTLSGFTSSLYSGGVYTISDDVDGMPVEKYTFIGLYGQTNSSGSIIQTIIKNFKICVSSESDIELYFKNFSFTGGSGSAAIYSDTKTTTAGAMVTLNYYGTNYIGGADGSTASGCAAINLSSLTITGDGALTVKGGDNVNTSVSAGYDGGVGINATTLNINFSGTLTVIGGDGGDGVSSTTAGSSGKNGGNGGIGIVAQTLKVSGAGTVLVVYGGDGGNGSDGVAGSAGTAGKTYSDNHGTAGGNGGDGGNGGNGGSGAYAIKCTTATIEDASVELHGGNGGDAGAGGNGGKGGNGGDGGSSSHSGLWTNYGWNGGAGGNGGNGGDAGSVGTCSGVYSIVTLNGEDAITTNKGSAGASAKGGDGGAGGNGGTKGKRYTWFDEKYGSDGSGGTGGNGGASSSGTAGGSGSGNTGKTGGAGGKGAS